MRIRYFLNSETDEPHIYDHDVDEVEVAEVLARPGADLRGRHESRLAIGQTSAGRYLQVVYLAEPGGVFVITAYEIRGMPLAAYRRRRKKKQP